jgi:putative transposase
MVSTSLSIPKDRPSSAFPLREKHLEWAMQYIKDRAEGFDDYFPCRKKRCKLRHVINWLNLFVDFHNRGLKTPR